MTKNALLGALAMLACVWISSAAWSADEESPADTADSPIAIEDVLAEARSMVAEGRFADALGILWALRPAAENEPEVLFLIGLTALEASQVPGLEVGARNALLNEAIAAFRRMLLDEPGLVRVRLELARAFFLKGEDKLSQRHFEFVLAGNPPPPVVANVRQFLAQIRARRRWSFHAGFSLAPDTNIGGTSDEQIIYIYGLPFERDADDLTTSGVGLTVWGGADYQYPLNQRHRLRLGGDIWRRDYAGSDFDRMLVSGHAGPRSLLDPRSEISVLTTVQRSWFGNVPDYDALGVRIEAGRRLTRRVTGNAQASGQSRQYRTRTFLDGPVADLTLGVSWVITPTLRANFGAGWGGDRPDVERWRHERRWLRAGVQVALPWGFSLGGQGELRRTDYEGDWFPHTAPGVPREDRTRSVRLSLHNRSLSWKGFSPQVSLVHEVRRTNAQLYDYRRTGGELRFVRLF